MTKAPIPENLSENHRLIHVRTQAELGTVFDGVRWTWRETRVVLIVTPWESIDPTLNCGWNSRCRYCEECCPDPETGVVDCSRCDSTGVSPDLTDVACCWLIIRGSCRPMHPQWIRDLVKHAEAAEVPVWFEGWGDWKPVDEPLDADTPQILLQSGGHRSSVSVFDGEFEHTIGTQQWMAQVGSNNSGCVLDMQVFHQLPGGIR